MVQIISKLLRCFFVTLYLTLNGFKVLDSYYSLLNFSALVLTFAPRSSHPCALACSLQWAPAGYLWCDQSGLQCQGSRCRKSLVFFLPFVRIAITMTESRTQSSVVNFNYKLSVFIQIWNSQMFRSFCKDVKFASTISLTAFIHVLIKCWSPL